jgi:hypothetical protein
MLIGHVPDAEQRLKLSLEKVAKIASKNNVSLREASSGALNAAAFPVLE